MTTGHAALHLVEPSLASLADCIEPGRLVELSSPTESARTTTAVLLLRQAQLAGETTAWIQPAQGALYPPDLDECGVDLDALIVVHVPREGSGSVSPHRLCKAAEVLLRSGGFGWVVVDLCEGAPSGSEAWQGRLLGLARYHQSRVVFLTDKPDHADSLGTLVGLRVSPHRQRVSPGHFAIEHRMLKNKSGAPLRIAPDAVRGPWGLR